MSADRKNELFLLAKDKEAACAKESDLGDAAYDILKTAVFEEDL